MSARSCSLGRTVFFEAQAFAMDEAPDGSIVHLETKAGKFCYKTTQGELPLRDPLAKKDGMRADQKPPPVAAHLTGRSAPRRPKSLRPFHQLEGLRLSA
jgi:hypothetical protein